MFAVGKRRNHSHTIFVIFGFSHNLSIKHNNSICTDYYCLRMLMCNLLCFDLCKVHNYLMRLKTIGDNFFCVACADLKIFLDEGKQFPSARGLRS